MKINFLLLTIITAAITSCSTSYKTGQTPDDVYYSPARLQTDEVRRDREENNTVDNTVYGDPEDREIRRRVHNRRYRRYDDRYNYSYGYTDPRYNDPAYGNPKYGTTQNTSVPRKTNLGAYTPKTTTPDSTKSANPKFGKLNNAGTNPVRTFDNSNNSSNKGSAVGNIIRRVFNGDNNNYNSGNSNNSSSTRTFDNRGSNNNSSNNSGSSNTKSSSDTKSTSAPVRTFGKQN